MNNISKWQWGLLLALGVTVQGFSADTSLDERIRFLEKKQGYGFTKGSNQGLLELDLLYWMADVDGVAYATTSMIEAVSGGAGTVNTEIKTRTPQFSYDPGVRLGAGFQSPYDLYDIFLVWTYFTTTGKDRVHGDLVSTPAPGDKVVFGQMGLINPLVSIPNEASANCHIRENLLDLQFARGIAVSRNFFMRPYFGLRGVWSDIEWDIGFNRTFVSPELLTQDAAQLKIRNEFLAGGGLIGVEIDWSAPLGFGVNIRGAGALAWGRSEEKTREKYTIIPAGSTIELTQNYHAKRSFYCLKGIWELFAGAFWETDFSPHSNEKIIYFPKKLKQHMSLRIQLGYEFQQWPNAGEKTNTQMNGQRDRFTLSFQGFTGGLRFVY